MKIDKKVKDKIILKLDTLGFSRDRLFPELDETAKYLSSKLRNLY